MKRSITVEDVPIPVGLRQAVVLQTRQVLFLYNMLKLYKVARYNIHRISSAFCSLHLGTKDRI